MKIFKETRIGKLLSKVNKNLLGGGKKGVENSIKKETIDLLSKKDINYSSIQSFIDGNLSLPEKISNINNLLGIDNRIPHIWGYNKTEGKIVIGEKDKNGKELINILDLKNKKVKQIDSPVSYSRPSQRNIEYVIPGLGFVSTCFTYMTHSYDFIITDFEGNNYNGDYFLKDNLDEKGQMSWFIEWFKNKTNKPI